MSILNIVLIGFMGTGKSTIGRRVAARLKMKFIDTDQDIEEVTDMSVTQLFKKHGEVRFRSEETAAVRRALRGDCRVIATGGGVVLNPLNVQMLKENGMLVCLTSDKEIIYERVHRKKNRPLLNGNVMEAIEKLLEEREPYYKVAELYLDTSKISVEEAVEEIVKAYREKAGR